MAKRRMFSLDIIDTDLFIDMPQTSRLLYYELCMRADDDGFVGSPKKIQKMVGCNDDDFKVLIAKKFIIPFDTGIIVIRHWKIHNYIQNDRYKETIYLEEKSQLKQEKNGAYTKCIQNVSTLYTQDRIEIGKDRIEIGKDRIEEPETKKKKEADINTLINEKIKDEEVKETLYEFIKMRKTIKKPLTYRGLELIIKKLYKITTNTNEQIEILNNSIMNNWQGIFELKNNKSYNNTKKGSFNDFKDMWEEAKKEDEQAGNNSNNNFAGW